MEMCRACLSTESVMIPLNDECLQNYKLLTNLMIQLDDDLPHCMCRKCWDSVETFVEFRNRCITAEESLHLILNNVNAEIDEKQDVKLLCLEDEVKVEIEDVDYLEYDDDDDYNVELEIKSELKETEYTKVKKETKKRVSSKPGTVVTRKRGRPRKNDTNRVPKIEKAPKDTSLPCGLCAKSYEDRESLFKHLEKHRKGTVCSTCQEEFKPWPQLMAHRINHIDENKRRCHICWKVFRVDFYLEYHYLTQHYGEEFPGLACRVCNKMISSARKMKGHLWSMHNDRKFTCDYCKKSFPNKNNLRIHIYQHSTKMNYFCDKCSFSCRYSNGLKKHTDEKHKSERKVKYICRKCRRTYKDQLMLTRHECPSRKCVCFVCGYASRDNDAEHKLAKHADISYKCKVCYRWFEDEARLEKHACIRSNFNVVCPDCGINLKHSGQLARHMLKHSDERAFKCKRCPATFKSASSLTIHTRKHDNIRPHLCDFCDMRFYTNAVRIKHMRVHTGEKPFVCSMCDKGFTGKHNLKVHMKVHGLDLVVKKGTEKTPQKFIFQ